jgi:hypothetical protein
MLTDVQYASVLLNLYPRDVLEIQKKGDAKHAFNKVVYKFSVVFGV